MIKFKELLIISTLILSAILSSCTPIENRTVNSNSVSALETEIASPGTCLADESWVASPSLPTVIPNEGANLCDFYQFSWQSFLYLMAPSSADASLRNFEVLSNYLIYVPPPSKTQASSTCTAPTSEHQIFVRVVKDDDANLEFVIPQLTGQAGGGATIYDQNKNVVYYSVQVSQDMCTKALSTSPKNGNLPEAMIELKFAWKVLKPGESDDYLTINAKIGNSSTDTTLGLIGMHLVQSTATHPELIWASFEQKNNAPDCLNASKPAQSQWSFLSSTCNTCLENPGSACLSSCKFNTAVQNSAKLTGMPSEICRLFPEGTDINNIENNGKKNGDGSTNNNGAQNISDVDSLNLQIVGVNGLVTTLPSSNKLAVLSNYINIGALWLSDPAKKSALDSNQRGSLQLENPVMETVFQGGLTVDSQNHLQASSTTKNALNCFSCHGYTPLNTKTNIGTASTGLSHVYEKLIPK